MKKIIYPDTSAVDYTYDGNGNIKDIKSGATTYAEYNSYTAVGGPLLIDYANDKANSTYQYLPQNNRLFSLTTNGTQGGLINISYGYDDAGNITGISDYMDSAKTRTYVYDESDRLTSAASVSYGGTLTYQYDKIGNMTYNSRKGNYSYTDPDHVHAVTQAGADTYTYDNNGNMTSGGNRTLTHDYDNRPTTITMGAYVVDSVYDAMGSRVTKTVSGQTTKYIGQLYECTGGVCTKYIFAGTKRIAQVKGTDTFYYHTDHLESSTVITDQNGNKVEELLYYPFGEILSDSSPSKVRYKYAGHEFDSESQLIYMGARYYDPKLARFVSADPVVPVRVELSNYRDFKLTQFRQLTNPQALNRYSYVVNNPIVFRDPLGLNWVTNVSTGLGIGSAVAGTVALANPAAKPVAAGVSALSAGFSYWANQTGRMSDSEAARNIGLAATDLSGAGLEARGFINLGNLIGIISRALGIANTGIDAAKAAGEKTQAPGPADAAKASNPANAGTNNTEAVNHGNNNNGTDGQTGKKSETESLSPPNLNLGTAASEAAAPPPPVNNPGSSGVTSPPPPQPIYSGC